MTTQPAAGRPLIAVVGGGISGLAAAYRIASFADVVLYERAHRVGGRLSSATFRDRPLDLGPDAFIVRNPAAVELCTELGIEGALVEPATKGAAILARGRLRPLPAGQVLGVPTTLGALARSGIVGPLGVARAALDLLATRPAIGPSKLAEIEDARSDPTVTQVLGRRLGARVVSSLVDPLVGGINAGDVRRLSFYSAMPQVAELLPRRASLMRALRSHEPATAGGGSIFRGLRGGISVLPDALGTALGALGATLRFEEVVGVERERGGRFLVRSARNSLVVDALVLAAPAYESAVLVAPLSAELATALASIPYASVATATFAYRVRDIPGRVRDLLNELMGSADDASTTDRVVLPGSGVLVPRASGRLVTAASFTSSKWPASANPGEVLIRASLGRHGDDRAESLRDDELVRSVERDLGAVLGIDASPLEVRIARFSRSFPQYVVGHRARVRQIDELAGRLGIELTGAALRGIGIPACIASGGVVAERLRARFADR